MAEADLRTQTQRSAEAPTDRDKYIAGRDARDAARRIKEAGITHQQAQEDAYNAGVKEQEQLEKTRTAPAAIVQTIGEKLKSGEIGYRGVKEEAEKLTRTKPQRRRLSVRNLIQRLNLIFDEKRDERVKNLQRLLVGDRLSPGQRQALIDALRAVKDRVTKYELLLQLLDTNDVKIDEW